METCKDVSIADEIQIVEARLAPSNAGQSTVNIMSGTHPLMRLDNQLKSIPGIGLFRRADSYTAHPTTQGLSMRGVGANAAGRVLVTLDGVPLNDPFGGWIYWSALAAETIPEIEILRGGGAGAFGAQALAGALDMRTRRIKPGSGSASAWLGSRGSYNLSGRTDFAVGDTGLSLSAGRFETDGAFLRSEDQRGPVDVPAASETMRLGGKLSSTLGGVGVKLSARYFKEQRTNGLSLSTNETEAFDIDLTLSGEGGDTNWEVISYYRTRDFANVFVSARDERTVERPVLDQFGVPAWGAGMLARIQFGGLELGVDTRRMSGEVNERYRNLGAGFTRQRRAGGDQWIMGLYGEYGGTAGDTDFSGTFRMDRWRTFGGQRLETDISDGSVRRDDVVPDRSDWIWSGRLGFERDITGAISVRGAAYKSWRLPTLNELYRPFRVVNDITEANPDLVPEKLYGLELGVDYTPLNTVSLSATLFRNWLSDGVGNITIGFGPGFFPLGGFVPPGGVLRQRANIDRSITDGLELEGKLALQNGWHISARYLYARARITKFAARPELVGKRPVQTPRHSAVLSLAYDNRDRFTFNTELRYSAAQFDDDLNVRTLEAIAVVNMGASYKLRDSVRLTANVENLFDTKVIAAITATGFETLAQRRFARIGIAVSF
jgi:outer membrane receptor protein involved in Fe transport